MKMMCEQVNDELLGKKAIDFAKIDQQTADANYRRGPVTACMAVDTSLYYYSVSDVKAAVAAIRFIVCNAVKYDVEEQVFAQSMSSTVLRLAS